MDFGGRAANGAQQGAAPDVMSWWVLILKHVDAMFVRLCSQGFAKFISIGFSHILNVFFSVECYTLVTHRYMEIPVVSRVYLTGAFLTTAACAVDIISPFSLYFNWDLVFSQGQIWRLITR